ncbi:metal/formaldehyde-sensitive transcriptional repressor [Xylophilus sp. GW821-FHT01B05]|jgi:DNA-binding FrmR family transcriptional regulator
MGHTIRDQKKLVARVRRIRGQSEALERALLAGVGCGPVLQQIAAIRGAVNGLMAEVLDGHLREHLTDENHTPQERAEELDEVLGVLRSYLR